MERRGRSLQVFWIGLFSVLSSVLIAAPTRANQVDNFTAAFSGTCDAMGPFTRQAVGMSQRLTTALEALKDEKCNSMANSLRSVETIARGLDRLRASKDKYYKEASANAFMGQLFSLMEVPPAGGIILSTPPGGTGTPLGTMNLEIPDFSSLLGSLGRAYVASRGIDITRNEEEINQRRAENLLIADYLTSLKQALLDTETCLIGQPNAPAMVIAQTMAMSGMYAGGELGGALMVVGTLLNESLEYFRQRPFEHAIADNLQTRFYPALSCGMEAMVTSYCELAQTRRLFASQVEVLMTREAPAELEVFEGLEILSRNYPKLSRWLQRIETGARAQTPEIATRYNRVLRKENRVLQVGHYADGQFGDARQRMNVAGMTMKQKNRIIQRFVNDISMYIFGYPPSVKPPMTDSENPYEEFFPTDSSCRFAWSLYVGQSNVPDPSETESENFCLLEMSAAAARAEDLDVIKQNFDEIQGEISRAIRADKARVLAASFDPQGTWLEGAQPDNLGNSNLRTFQLLMDYLSKLKSRWTVLLRQHPDRLHLKFQTKHIEDFELSLARVIHLIENETILGKTGKPLSYTEKIDEVKLHFKLNDQFDYFVQKIIIFIETDVSERIRGGELDEELADILRRAAHDYVYRLLALQDGGTLNTAKITTDLNEALPVSQNTLDHYADFFGHHLVKAIQHHKQESVRRGEPQNPIPVPGRPLSPPHYTNAARLCLLAATASDGIIKNKLIASPLNLFVRKTLNDVCRGMTYYTPVYLDTKLKLSYDDVISRPWEERVCAFFSLQRKNEIYDMHSKIQKRTPEPEFNFLKFAPEPTASEPVSVTN